MDKIYLSTPTKIAILDHEKKRTFVIRKDGLPDAGMADFIWSCIQGLGNFFPSLLCNSFLFEKHLS